MLTTLELDTTCEAGLDDSRLKRDEMKSVRLEVGLFDFGAATEFVDFPALILEPDELAEDNKEGGICGDVSAAE